MQKVLGTLALCLLVISAAALPALAAGKNSNHYSQHASNPWGSPVVTNPVVTPKTPATSTPITNPVVPPPATPVTPPVPAAPSSGEVTLSAYVTGYSYWDNTPAGSTEISHPVIHQTAGGTGTYSDPITLAVGHSIINGKDILDYPAGTKFYIPYLEKYAIVEDTCGDGATPQNGPCHTGYQGHVWVDLYVDGANVSSAVANACMDNITDVHTIIENPASTYPVLIGSVTGTGCKMF